jgi:hypothetical protein
MREAGIFISVPGRAAADRAAAGVRRLPLRMVPMVLSLWTLSGCFFWSERSVGTPRFSPNGRWMAHAGVHCLMEGFVDTRFVETPLEICLKADYQVVWCDPARPKDRTVIDVDVGTREPWGPDFAVDLKFSPDSRRLAVVTRYDGVTVVEPAAGRRWRVSPKGEEITSSAWCGDNELGYIAHTHVRGPWRDRSDRTLWRVRVDRPIHTRIRVFTEEGVRSMLREPWPRAESWSPDGRYVVLLASRPNGPFQVRDTATGERFAPPQRLAEFAARQTAWKPDGSAVLCLSSAREASASPQDPEAMRHEAMLIDPARRTVLDVSKEFTAAFGRCQPRLRLSPAWTSEGRCLVVNMDPLYGAVVQLKPWHVIQAGARLREVIGPGAGPRPYQLHVLPTPGRLWAVSGLQLVMTDYEGRPLARSPYILTHNPEVTISPDGRFVVIRDLECREQVIVQRLGWVRSGGEPADDEAASSCSAALARQRRAPCSPRARGSARPDCMIAHGGLYGRARFGAIRRVAERPVAGGQEPVPRRTDDPPNRLPATGYWLLCRRITATTRAR